MTSNTNKDFRKKKKKKLKISIYSKFERQKSVDEFHLRLKQPKHKNEFLKQTYVSRLKRKPKINSVELTRIRSACKDACLGYKNIKNPSSHICKSLSLKQKERRKGMNLINKERKKIESNLDYSETKGLISQILHRVTVK